MKRIVFLERMSGFGYSIERQFEELRRWLPPEWSTEVLRCPTPGGGKLWLPKGLASASRCRADVYHVVSGVQYLAAATPAMRTVVTVCDLGSLNAAKGLKKLLFRLSYYTVPMRKCKAITVISETTRERLIKAFPWCDEKVTVIPDPLVTGFEYVPKDLCKGRINILIIGTGEQKNLPRAIRALSGFACTFIIIGRLSEIQRRALADSRSDYENIEGATDGEVVEWYRRCDIVLFPSLHEGFGMPIIEGQATGRIVITSDLEPMRSVAGDGAVLVDPYSESDIRAAVTVVVENPELRGRLLAAGLRNAARYEPKAIAGQYAALYQRLLGDGHTLPGQQVV